MRKKPENLVLTRFFEHIFSNFITTKFFFFRFISSKEEVTLLMLKIIIKKKKKKGTTHQIFTTKNYNEIYYDLIIIQNI